jgi:integrase
MKSAVEIEVLARYVPSVKPPPKVDDDEVEILAADEIKTVVDKLAQAEHPLNDIVVTDLATGLYWGELLAPRLSDVDLDDRLMRVERSLEKTKDGLRFKSPKTNHGKRHLATGQRGHRAARGPSQPLKMRMAMGLGKPDSSPNPTAHQSCRTARRCVGSTRA